MLQTTNYGLKQYEENDLMNPFIVDNANMATIDGAMKANSDAAISTATELKTGTVHAITRTNGDAAVFRFTATSNYESGDTFTVDNVQVTALLTDGTPLGTGCYNIGAEVLCSLSGTRLTVFVQRGSVAIATDSERLGGELPAYYAKDSDMQRAEQDIELAMGAARTANDNIDEMYQFISSADEAFVTASVSTGTLNTGTTSTVLTSPVSTGTGIYMVSFYIRVSGATAGTLYIIGSTRDDAHASTYPTFTTRLSSSGKTAVLFSTLMSLNDGQTLRLKAVQNSGSTVNIESAHINYKRLSIR